MAINVDYELKAKLREPGPSLRKMERRSKQWQHRPFDRHRPSGINHEDTLTAYKKGRRIWKEESRKRRVRQRKG